MENYLPEIINNIKQEPERHFLVILPGNQEASDESDEIREQTILNSRSELRINVRKFNAKWGKTKVELFSSFHVCKNCEYVFIKSSHLDRHFSSCKRKEIKCFFCDQKFKENARKIHEQQEHRKGSTWQCNQCPYNTLLRGSLQHHSSSHFKKYSCETCAKKFTFPYLLRDHQTQHQHGVYIKQTVTRLQCNKCEKSFAHKNRLSYHKRQVHSQKIFHCDICGKIFKTKSDVRKHIFSIHVKTPCLVCSKPIAKDEIKLHMKENLVLRKYDCDMCGKFVKTKANIRRHMNIHAKVPCSICRKPITVDNMKKHMKSLHPAGKFFLACRIFQCKQKLTSINQ